MPTAKQIMTEINTRIRCLMELGLADDQSLAFIRPSNQEVAVTFPNAQNLSLLLKNRAYRDTYDLLVQERVYNVRMLDGALIQMSYGFSGSSLRRHRLAFLPAPHLDKFQNDPDIYLDDELYGDVVARNVVPFPVRYDYDGRDGRQRELAHPESHLTLGQYEHCRIPVSAPVTPHWFIDFVLRNFYHTAKRHYAEELPTSGPAFVESILPAERRVIHVTIPR